MIALLPSCLPSRHDDRHFPSFDEFSEKISQSLRFYFPDWCKYLKVQTVFDPSSSGLVLMQSVFPLSLFVSSSVNVATVTNSGFGVLFVDLSTQN
ncbi:hypothetical protein GEMRC1_007607 [Eukaryota sp. GEM-RC1]